MAAKTKKLRQYRMLHHTTGASGMPLQPGEIVTEENLIPNCLPRLLRLGTLALLEDDKKTGSDETEIGDDQSKLEENLNQQ